jgi:hypothetical protein
MSEHYDDGEQLDPSIFNQERFRNLIELGLVNLNHSDRERSNRSAPIRSMRKARLSSCRRIAAALTAVGRERSQAAGTGRLAR